MRIVIAAPSSGSGKTSVTAGIIGALRVRGLRVQPFKAGPDYIDPSYHTLAAGLPARNLDSWMLEAASLRELFHRASSGADIAVVEGVMGLYDGKSGCDGGGSTAELAKLIDAPVLLVVDVRGMAQSAAALVLGYQRFDPDLRLAGVLLNNVGGPAHEQWAREAVEQGTGLPVLGALPRSTDLMLPERHLGLIPVAEGDAQPHAVLAALADHVARSFDLDGILEIASRSGAPPAPKGRLFPREPRSVTVAIGLARDEAFSFYYQDNLDLLAAWGAELVPFSPLHDATLPADVAGLYLGGGFPELFAEQLAANAPMRRAIAGAIARQMPVYAECGGLMYLGQGIVDFEGRRHEMAGAMAGWSSMRRRRLTLGYRVVRARRDSALLRTGEIVRGHEFHWSDLDHAVDASEAAYDVLADPSEVAAVERTEGYSRGNLLASYVHLHFGAKPELAPRFIDACAAWSRGQTP